MHLTCENVSITPDRNGSVKRPDKVSRSYHRHSQRRKDWIESWPFPFPVQKKNVKKSRLRQTCKPRNESVGEGFSAKPHATAVKNNLQVRHGDQPWYPHVLWPLRWTIAHSTWMVPLHLNKCNDGKSPKNKKKPIMTISAWVRSFTSFQMFHTHTVCKSKDAYRVGAVFNQTVGGHQSWGRPLAPASN